jgi:aminoglycoside phosphotransferase (APT) family kinase protein
VRDGRLAALIDFGDVCAGDPATDLAAGWLFFHPEDRAAFRAAADARRDYDAADWVRARAWALIMGSAIDAHSDDDPAMAALAAHTLTQVAEG